MASRERALIDSIEHDALDGKADLAGALRKCLSLAGGAGSEELLQWATRELRGYGADDKLPAYRQVVAPILLDGVRGNYKITGQRISPSALPSVAHGTIDETLHLRHAIGQLEVLVAQAREREGAVKMSLPGGADLVRLFNHEADEPFQQVMNLYWSVDASTLAAIGDNVRTTLVELMVTLRRGMSSDEDTPSPALAAQAVSIAVYGDKSRVVVRDVNVAGSHGHVTTGKTEEGGPASRVKLIAAIGVGVLTVAAAALKLAEALGVSAPGH